VSQPLPGTGGLFWFTANWNHVSNGTFEVPRLQGFQAVPATPEPSRPVHRQIW